MLRKVSVALALVFCLGGITPVHAQAPTTAQRNAIRQFCRADYESMCASVPPGGRASLQCLQEHIASLSPACQSAVGAVSPQPGRPTSSATRQPARPAEACRADYREFCPGFRPGGGRVMMCLREHAAELSPQCQEALESLRR